MSVKTVFQKLMAPLMVLLLFAGIAGGCMPDTNGPNPTLTPTVQIEPSPISTPPPSPTTSSTLALDNFGFLEPGTSYEQVVDQVGEPDRDIGSGVYLFQYDLVDGSVVTLQFISLDELIGAWVTEPGGVRKDLLDKSE